MQYPDMSGSEAFKVAVGDIARWRVEQVAATELIRIQLVDNSQVDTDIRKVYAMTWVDGERQMLVITLFTDNIRTQAIEIVERKARIGADEVSTLESLWVELMDTINHEIAHARHTMQRIEEAMERWKAAGQVGELSEYVRTTGVDSGHGRNWKRWAVQYGARPLAHQKEYEGE